MRTVAEILKPLTEEQKKAVQDYTGKVFINAAPGSGKTSCIVARTEYMIVNGVRPSSILLFTFTKKAAEEMRERLERKIGSVAKTMTICTYHSFCARLLRRYAELVGWENDFSIYDENDKKALFSKIIKKDQYLNIYDVMNIISHWKDNIIDPDQATRTAKSGKYAKCAIYYHEYMKAIRQRNAFDFDDLLYFGFKLISKHEEVLRELSSKYTYVMSDETQDSSVKNLEFIMLLSSINGNVTLIADTDQSIYGFRGADVNNFARTITKYNFKVYNLTRNFRSTQTIVDAAHRLIKNNNAPIQKDTFSKNKVGDKIYFYELTDTNAEAKFATQVVKFMHDEKKVPYSEIAILCRMNYQTRVVEDTFLMNSIPYTISSGVSFYSRQEVKDIIAYLRMAMNPYDVEAFERSIQAPKHGVGKGTIQKIEDHLFKLNESCDKMYTVKSYCEKFAHNFNKNIQKGLSDYWKTIDQLRDFIDKGIYPEEVLTWLVDTINYEKYLYDTEKEKEVFETRRQNIKELILIASAYTTFEDFMDNISLNSDTPEEGEKDDSVNIMTMHASKGLEFKTVIILGMNEGTCPSRHMLSNPDDIKEERRLFYVAMTRAKENLFILRPKTTFSGSAVHFCQKSRFVSEIPSEYMISHTI